MKMLQYQYQILRFIPNHINGEFVNVGLFFYCKESSQFLFRFMPRLGRINTMFPSIELNTIKKYLTALKTNTEKFADSFQNNFIVNHNNSIDQITSQIIPKDNGAFYFNEYNHGRTLDCQASFDALYNDFIIKYEKLPTKNIVSDDDVWRKYKEYFSPLLDEKKLRHHTIKTKEDEFQFDHCWKNGKWNAILPVSFHLEEPRAIKSKVYTWLGKASALQTSNEPFAIHFLLEMPKYDISLSKFIINNLGTIKTDKLTTSIIQQENLSTFVEDIKRVVDSH